MSRSTLFAGTAILLFLPVSAIAADVETVETVTVTAARLNEARVGIQPQTGASTYTITDANIQAQPGGDSNLLNQVVLQAPGVAQDSFGQLHVRGEHNGLQYRLNGIIIPEGISVFGQTLDPRFVGSLKLITGALPAEYGLRTAGIIDVETKTGFQNGGDISMYGGSHSELNPGFDYGGTAGSLNYFATGDYLTNTRGIESPDGSVDPLHDRTKQWHGFGFVQDILDANSSVTAILGTSNDVFQIPNRHGLQPSGIGGVNGLGPGGVLQVNGQFLFPSENLNENQREITHYGIVSYLRSMGDVDVQVSAYGRYSSLFFTPDAVGDVLYNGIAQTAYKRDVAYGLQAEGAWHATSDHTVRAGVIYQADDLTSNTSSQVLGVDALGNQTSDVPVTIVDNGKKHAWSYSLYLQDEWKVFPTLTLNYGVRWDQFQAFDAESQLSPRVNFVWTPTDTTTVHGGYSRYFSPPPFELVATTDVALYDNTTAAADHTDHTPKAERADYYDVGIQQIVVPGLTVGLDSFYKSSHNLIDEGQFGAPIILTPFNYRTGRQYGVELSANFDDGGPFTGYLNAAYERAVGRHIVSSEFVFSPDDLAYISTHFIPLDHQQLGSFSAGASYLWHDVRFSADMLYGTGLRRSGTTPNGNHVPGYVQINLGVSHTFDCWGRGLTARFDVINLFDEKYEIRDGTGVGVGAPQFGPRRGFFFGLSQAL
ncbi:MAG: TonB-dependent receptor [Alphaproteobacteria bacterium]|nr:TonB-dependent receptor [Alphaproteobacteria bacterium]MBL7099428.1 TonB-dependent receptor [Alphaproteobacteria bacterium]